MPIPGHHSRQEILTQKFAWESALAGVHHQASALNDIYQRNAGRDLLFVACGSPYYLGLSAAAQAQAMLKRRARAVPSSELLLFPESALPPGPPPLVIAVTRSGETSETIAAVRAMRQRGAGIVAVGCDIDSTVLREADVAVALPAGQEVSVAQTRSFSGMLLAVQAIIALWSGDHAQMLALQRLPLLADLHIEQAWAVTEQIIAQHEFERFFFLAAGMRFGLACEGMLKMKEMSLSQAEAFHIMEFRHGPMSMVDEKTLVVGLVSTAAAKHELAVLREMRGLGAQTLAVGEAKTGLEDQAHTVLAFQSGLPEPADSLLYLPVLQSLAFHRASSKGLDCDNPRHLSAYISLPDLG